MKKLIIIFAAAVCALCACQKHEIELLDKPIIEKLDNGQVSYTFTAIIADEVSDAETKATIERDGSFTWAENDELKFYESNGTSANARITKVDGSTATISVTTENPRANFVSAIYPASAAVAKDQITFNKRGPIVVSAVNGGTLNFHHIGSLVKIKFTDIPAGTASLVFKPVTAFGYDGHFDFSGRVPYLKAGGTTTEIVVPASTEDEDKDITICVPSVTLTGGFSAALNNNLAGTGRNLFKKSTTTAHNLGTAPPMLLNMKKVAYVAPHYYITTTTTSSPSVTVTKASFVRTGATTYELGFNTAPNTSYAVYDSYNDDALVSGSINSVSASGIHLYGAIYGNGSNNWDSAGDGPTLNVSNGVFSLLNQSVGESFYYRFYDTVADNNKVLAPNNGGVGENDWWISPGTDFSVYWGNYDTPKSFYIQTTGTYDFYLKDWSGNNIKHCIYSHSSTDMRPDYRTTLFVYNSSSNSVTATTDKGYHADAFSTYSDLDDLNLHGNFSGSWIDHTLTYNGNHSWSTTLDMTGSEAREYEFQFRKGSSWDSARWGNPNSNTYPYSDSQTFGTCESGGTNNLHVYLEKAIYEVYVNDMTWESNKLRFDFVKVQ